MIHASPSAMAQRLAGAGAPSTSTGRAAGPRPAPRTRGRRRRRRCGERSVGRPPDEALPRPRARRTPPRASPRRPADAHTGSYHQEKLGASPARRGRGPRSIARLCPRGARGDRRGVMEGTPDAVRVRSRRDRSDPTVVTQSPESSSDEETDDGEGTREANRRVGTNGAGRPARSDAASGSGRVDAALKPRDAGSGRARYRKRRTSRERRWDRPIDERAELETDAKTGLGFCARRRTPRRAVGR